MRKRKKIDFFDFFDFFFDFSFFFNILKSTNENKTNYSRDPKIDSFSHSYAATFLISR